MKKIYWVILVPLSLILLTIFSWCFYFRFIRAFLSRRKLVYVEVQNYLPSESMLSRKEAKLNLKLVIETTTGVRLENQRFDRFWFEERKNKLDANLGYSIPADNFIRQEHKPSIQMSRRTSAMLSNKNDKK